MLTLSLSDIVVKDVDAERNELESMERKRIVCN